MKKFAKLLSMVLAVAMVLTMFAGAYEYDDNNAIDEDKLDAVYALYDYGVMQGNDKGEFNPKGYLTRDEMSKIMYALDKGGWTEPASYYGGFLSAFADEAKIPNWGRNYLGYAFMRGIFIGNDRNEINALSNLSYVEAAIVLLRALGVEDNWKEIGDGVLINGGSYKVGDVTYSRYEGPKWFENAVIDGDVLGLFDGLDIENFKGSIIREDVAVMVNNAIEVAEANTFTLATKASGVVVGVGGTDDKFLTLDDGALYPIGDLDVADYIGRNVEFAYSNKDKADDEDKELVSEIKIVNSTVYETTIDGVKFEDKDTTLKIGEDKILDKTLQKDYDTAYIFSNGAFEREVIIADSTNNASRTLVGWFNWEKEESNFGFQNVTVIVNSDAKAISVIYNPVVFANTSDLTIIAEVKDKVYTGKYYVTLDGNNIYVPELLTELSANTWFAAILNGDTAELVGFPQIVDISKLSATKRSTPDGDVYSFSVDGETAINVADVAAAFPADNSFAGTSDAALYNSLAGDGKNIVVFENKIIALNTTASEAVSTAVVLDFSSTYSGGIEYVTIDAIVNGALDQLTVKADAISDTIAADNIYVIGYADEDNGDVKEGDMTLTADTYQLRDFTIKQFVTALGSITLNNSSGDRTVNLAGKTLIGYDVQTNTIFDANNLVVIGDDVKLDGKNIVKDALSVDISSNVVIVYYDIGD